MFRGLKMLYKSVNIKFFICNSYLFVFAVVIVIVVAENMKLKFNELLEFDFI